MLPVEKVFDISFYVVIGGIIGARIYHIFLELPYYSKHPMEMVKIWQGGLAIHGGIIAGLVILILLCRKEKIDFWKFSAAIAPGLALGQAIGRWGNYFNQELFGLPTDLPWGIPIELMHRPMEYLNYGYFHPTFIYESIGNLAIFGVLLYSAIRLAGKESGNAKMVLLSYLALYSILRFSTEFIRIDQTALVFGWRWPQIFSAMIFIVSVAWMSLILKGKMKIKKTP